MRLMSTAHISVHLGKLFEQVATAVHCRPLPTARYDEQKNLVNLDAIHMALVINPLSFNTD